MGMTEAVTCACPCTDAYHCIRARYPQQFLCDDASDARDLCECVCHDEWEEDEWA